MLWWSGHPGVGTSPRRPVTHIQLWWEDHSRLLVGRPEGAAAMCDLAHEKRCSLARLSRLSCIRLNMSCKSEWASDVFFVCMNSQAAELALLSHSVWDSLRRQSHHQLDEFVRKTVGEIT